MMRSEAEEPAPLTQPQRPALIKLGQTWKFKTDPTQAGARANPKWSAEDFDDGSWANMRSGASWEAQGVSYSGFAWYRQHVTLPASFIGIPLKLTLADFYSDDDVFFNGVRIGGLKGEYKYKNLSLRVYFIPSNIVRAGADNVIAIRLWGGRLGFQGAKSGLIAGSYVIEPVPFGLAARDAGSAPGTTQPLQLYDLSDAQRGHPFDLVFRFEAPATSTQNASFTYKLTDFYGETIHAGLAQLQSEDGVLTSVVRVDPRTARAIYLAGRFKALSVLTDQTSGKIVSQNILVADHLSFEKRDRQRLAALPETRDITPYGRLKLVDEIDAATPDDKEVHPYMESSFGNHAQDFMTPGAKADIAIHTILGRSAREPTWSWFAYRVGRGKLQPGHTYLLRISYPEDKPRYAPIGIESGQDYMDVGLKTGISHSDIYEHWPLTQSWQDYDVIVPLGTETVGTGGAGDGDGSLGFWVYFMDQRKPGFYFSDYQGGAAVSTIKLYDIDADANEPLVMQPDHLPRRMMTFDWERQPTASPTDMVAYARLMGYSAISPTILKWGFTNFAQPVRGYTTASVDAAHYWETDPQTNGLTFQSKSNIIKSVHEQYLEATRESGINYLPRVEYGGSNVLPIWARAIGADGRPAKPDRFASWGADLLRSETLNDFKAYIDKLFQPYIKANAQFKGMLWRSRQDRLQISYSREDIVQFAREAPMALPSGLDGLSPAEIAEWATTPPVAPIYIAWWQRRRTAFQQQIAHALQAYRPDLTLLYYNWDQDKFSLIEPDRLSSAFAAQLQRVGGPTAYAEDRAKRRAFSAADYTNVLETGFFSGSLPKIKRPGPWPDYALLPPLYTEAKGVQILAPVPGLPYADEPGYINYFQTKEGLAVSNIVSYNEIGAREPNPKYEGTMVLPGGAPFSMSVELLSYFYGDVRTLTYTAYTYGRGFAAAHRRFAQAFRALPAIPGQLVSGTPDDVAARTYETSIGSTYIGVAYKGMQQRSLSIDIPGSWSKRTKITNLVTGDTQATRLVGSKLHLDIDVNAMELDAFVVH